MGVDGHPLAKEELYRGGALHRYEAEQIYRWVPAARCLLEKAATRCRCIPWRQACGSTGFI